MNELEIILNYIKEHPEISNEEKKFLISYIARKKSLNSFEKYDITMSTIIEDIKELNKILSKAKNTSLTAERINKELEILTRLSDLPSDEELIDISYKLEMLYRDSDMPPRKTDTVITKIHSTNNKKERG